MGVVTTADRKLESAKEHIEAAIKDLNELLDLDTWGTDDYNSESLKKYNRVRSGLFDYLQDM